MSELEKLYVYYDERYTKSWKNKKKPSSEYRKMRREKIKNKLYDILGNVCIRCGFSDKRALQFDHINGGGKREILLFKGNENMYRFYSKNPKDTKERLQVLCANCNWIKRDENGEHA